MGKKYYQGGSPVIFPIILIYIGLVVLGIWSTFKIVNKKNPHPSKSSNYGIEIISGIVLSLILAIPVTGVMFSLVIGKDDADY